ncbi:MAG: orotidine-5'-phosphate decarboxylase [Oscillospiraceae bacterium]|nr:orotidine-5'-phosphate decarboxylase [Oscillospiraceae bacterium]
MSVRALIKAISEKNNPTVIGLDPKLEYIPEEILDSSVKKYGPGFRAAGEAIFEFNKGLIDAVCDIIPCVKPQSAFYEMYGIHGLEALRNTAAYAKKCGMYVILDAKRGDIGSTAEAYSNAYLGKTDIFGKKMSPFYADALTVNPYLGSDGIKPFLNDCNENGKMIFALVKTSNPSSGELQDIETEYNGEKMPLYMRCAMLVKEWANQTRKSGGYRAVGAVAGATYPEQLKEIRDVLPGVFLLVPGYGAQGAKGEDIAGAFDKNGLGAVVNSSRGLICAYKKLGGDYKTAARDAALDMKNDINKFRGCQK